MIHEAARAVQAQPVTAAEAFVRGGRGRLRTLVVCAAPLGPGMPLDLRREWSLLRRHAEESRVPVTLFRLLPPTPEAFKRALQRCAERQVPPHIIHFAGHGQPRYLCFEDELGREARIQREDLAAALREHHVPVLVLNACHSATKQTVSLAKYLVEEGAVEVAVGHREPVADSAAVTFAGELYRQLCSGEEAYLAFVQARSLLSRTHPDAVGAIELFGNDSLLLTPQARGEDPGPRIFDGTYGRGRMPEVPAFFGREEEMVRLARVLADDSMRGAALVGIGGIGKTTIALELANRHAWRYPGGMAFASVRSILYGEPSADELIRSATSTLLVSAIGGALPEERLLEHLQQQPGLLVFDNLEDLPEQELERLLKVVEQLPLNGSRAMLTLRPSPQLLHERPWLQVVALTSGLAERAGAAYVVRQGREKAIPSLAEATVDTYGVYLGLPLQLTRALSGHPKMLDVAVGIVARGRSELNQAVPELEVNESGIGVAETIAAIAMDKRMDALYGSSVDLLDEEGRWLLALLPVFPDGSFTCDELLVAAVATRDETAEDRSDEVRAKIAERLGNGVDSCLRAGLIDRGENHPFHCHPTVQEYAHKHLRLDESTSGRMFLGLLEAALIYINVNQDDYPAIDRRLGHLLGLFEVSWRQQNKELLGRVHRAVNNLGYFLLHRGYWPIMARWQERLAKMGDESLRSRGDRLFRDSILLFNQGKVVLARKALEEALRIDEDLGDIKGQGASLHHLAIIAESLGEHDEARALLLESIRMASETSDTHGHGAALHQLAIIEEAQGRYDEACDLLHESITLKEKTGDTIGHSASLHMLAIVRYHQGRLGEASNLARESIQISREIGDTKGISDSLYQLALIEGSQGKLDDARNLLRESMRISEEIGHLKGYAACLHQLSAIEESQGRYEQARELLHESIQISEEIHDFTGRATSLYQLSSIDVDQGKYSEARVFLQEAIQVFQETDDTQNLGSSLLLFADISERQGRHEEARDLLRESIQLFQEIGYAQGHANALYQIAIFEGNQGRFSEARSLLRQSIQVFDMIGDTQGRAASLHQLATIEFHKGAYDEARALLQESIQISEELGDSPGLGDSLHLLATIEYRREQYDVAHSLLRESTQIAEQIGDTQGRASSLHLLAIIVWESQGKLEEACDLLHESMDILEEAGNVHDRAVSLLVLSQIEADAGELQCAVVHAREAVEVLRMLGSLELEEAEDNLSDIEYNLKLECE